MKHAKMCNICVLSLISFSFSCNAEDEKNITPPQHRFTTQPATELTQIEKFYQIPDKTYDYLNHIFTSFYKKITFKNEIAQSTFEVNDHYELISIPLIAENDKGVQLEVFGNFTNSETDRLSNFSSDQTLSVYYSNTEIFDLYQSQLSVGAGISFNASKASKIKVIISNNNMPGYGNSRALLGFETSF